MKNFNILLLSRDPNFFDKNNTYSLIRHIDYSQNLNKKIKNSKVDIISPNKNNSRDIHIKNLSIYGYKENYKFLYFFKSLKIFFNKLYRKKKINLVATQFPYYTFLGVFIKLLTKSKLFVQIPFNCFSIDWVKERFLNIFILVFGLLFLPFANKIQVLSKSQKKILKKFFKNTEIEVIPIPCQKLNYKSHDKKYIVEKYKKYFNGNFLYILFVGRFSKQKNLTLWINVANKILNIAKKNNVKIKLFIIGDGPEKQKILKSINLLKNKKFFNVINWLNREEIEYFYKKSDIYFLSSNYEATPRCVQEAHLMYLPVISTLSTGTEDIISHGKTGYLTKVKDEASLIAYMKKIILNKSLRHKMSKNAHIRYNKYFNYNYLVNKKVSFWIK